MKSPQDDLRLAVVMTKLQMLFGKETTTNPMVLEIYSKALADLSIEQIEAAAEEHMKLGKFTPLPADLRERVAAAVPPYRKFDPRGDY